MKLSLLEWKLLQWLKEDRRSYTVGQGRAYFANAKGRITREGEKLAIKFVTRGFVEPDLFGNMRLSDAGRKAVDLPRPEWQAGKKPALKSDDYQVLRELIAATRSRAWVAPLDCGGSNGSDHSVILVRLARHGFVEIRQKGNPTGRTGDAIVREPSLWRHPKGSRYYRPTDAGRARVSKGQEAGQ